MKSIRVEKSLFQESKNGPKRLGFQMIHRRKNNDAERLREQLRQHSPGPLGKSREFRITETGLSSREEPGRFKHSIDLRSSGPNASKRDLWRINGFSQESSARDITVLSSHRSDRSISPRGKMAQRYTATSHTN